MKVGSRLLRDCAMKNVVIKWEAGRSTTDTQDANYT